MTDSVTPIAGPSRDRFLAPDDEAGVGAIALAIAVVCGVLAWWLAGVLGEPDDGDNRLPPPPEEDEAELRSAA
ncbi:MAG: hypothetical protein ACHQIG_12685 [Acidimicrobiia bacterium]